MNSAKSSKGCRGVLIAVALAFLGQLCVATPRALAQNPVPLINQPLVPDATAPGGPDFTLTVNGTGFVSDSVVNWNGSPLTTTFISGSQLTAVVPAADIAAATTASVTVATPAPGGGTSNVDFFPVTTNRGDSVAFNLASSPAVGLNPSQMARGDFNGDGKLDLAVANENGNTISILLGDGTGNFTLASTLTTGSAPYQMALGDFNQDGKLDLAVANVTSNTLTVFLGDATGNFTLVSSPATGEWPSQVVAGDFNRDGKLDLAVTNQQSNTVSVLLGDGKGNFTLASSPATSAYPYAVSVGDFNGDGKLDLAVADLFASAVNILLGDGTGNFSQGTTIGTGAWPDSVVVGDYNRDGKLDLAVSEQQGNAVSILLGDGTGNFTVASTTSTGSSPQTSDVGDLNGDGTLDLVVPNAGNNTASVLLGDGMGNFALASSPATGSSPFSVEVGDFNGDGRLDLAVANFGDNTVSILLQVPPGPTVTLSATRLTFGTQLVFTGSDPQTVTLTNTGTATLEITSMVASTGFSQHDTCGSSLAVGAKCSILAIFTPNKIGTITGTITITDNAADSPQTISLSGVGTVVSLSPTSLNFGSQRVGTTSPPQVVILTNHGVQTLNIAGTQFVGRNPGDFAQTNTCGTSVPAGASCTFSITFTPQGKASRSATMGVADSGGGGPHKVSLSGVGW
jgi:hypothetical protein